MPLCVVALRMSWLTLGVEGLLIATESRCGSLLCYLRGSLLLWLFGHGERPRCGRRTVVRHEFRSKARTL